MAKPYSHRATLAVDLEAARRGRGLSYAELARAAGIDTAQAMRICNGQFVTLSANVLKICRALEVAPPSDDLRLPIGGGSQSAARLQSEVIAAWDETQEGADNLIALLRTARRIRDQSGRPT
jgi:DNA-binding Xre family transcriptional regulator